MEEIIEHLREPYRVYAIQLEAGVNKRPGQTILFVHIGRPVSFRTVCNQFIFDNIELTIETTGEKILTSGIVGVQKVPNGNKPEYELTATGILKPMRD